MNKKELITAVAEKGHLTEIEAKRAIEAFTETISEELRKGEKVQLVGFGTFKAGKLLKDKVNE